MKPLQKHERRQVAEVEAWLREEHPDATFIFASGGDAEVRETLQEASPGKPLVELVSIYVYGPGNLDDAQLSNTELCVLVRTYEAIDRRDERMVSGFSSQTVDADSDTDDDAPLGAYTFGEEEDEYGD